MRQQGINGWHGVRAGSCHAWALPADETCAGVARRLFADASVLLNLEDETLDDAILMASELAANTLHARAARSREREDSVTRGGPELWLYLRGVGLGRELVCKVFDCYRGWLHGRPPAQVATVPAQAGSGRGLHIVQELSAGRWGYHPTRARVGGAGLRGKAVWFAVPAPFAHARLADVTGLHAYSRSVDVTAARRREQISARQAARELKAMLVERGMDPSDADADANCSGEAAADASLLSLCHGLTLWFRSGAVSLRSPDGYRERWSYTDLVEATEQTIWRHEELVADRSQALATA